MKQTIKYSIVTKIVIDAPAKKVWDTLTNPGAFEAWNPYMIKSVGEVKPKARLVNTMRIEKNTMTFKPVVQQVIPIEYFDWVGNRNFRWSSSFPHRDHQPRSGETHSWREFFRDPLSMHLPQD